MGLKFKHWYGCPNKNIYKIFIKTDHPQLQLCSMAWTVWGYFGEGVRILWSCALWIKYKCWHRCNICNITQLKEISRADLSSESLIARQSPTPVTARYPRPLADQLFAFQGPAPGPQSELRIPPIWAPVLSHIKTAAQPSASDYLVSISRIK